MSSKRKILFTSHTANFQKFNRPFMRMLRGSLEGNLSSFNIGDWEVDYASANEEEIFDADNSYKIDFPRSPFNLIKLLRSYRQLKKLLSTNHYDIIHTHTPVGSVVTRLAARKTRKTGTKVIYTAHGFHFYKGAPLKNWLLWYPIEKALAHYCDYLITINDEDYRLAKAKFKTVVYKIDGVGIDTEKYDKKLSSNKKVALRKELGLSKDDYIIVYTGEFNPDKNHAMLINGLAPLLKENSNIKIVLLGKGVLMENIKSLTEDHGVAEQVIFLGYRNDVKDILQICDLYVSPSKREGLVVSVLEAIYSKLPVILYDNRGHRQILGKHRENLFTTESEMKRMVEEQFANKKNYCIPFDEKFSLRSALASMRKIYLRISK